MTDKLVAWGSGSCEGEATVLCEVWPTVMELQPGLSGTAGRERSKYQAKILWPNLAVLDDAPATAKVGELKKVRAAACMAVGFFGMTWERGRCREMIAGRRKTGVLCRLRTVGY